MDSKNGKKTPDRKLGLHQPHASHEPDGKSILFLAHIKV